MIDKDLGKKLIKKNEYVSGKKQNDTPELNLPNYARPFTEKSLRDGYVYNHPPCNASAINIDPNRSDFSPLICEAGSGKSDSRLGGFCSDFHGHNKPYRLKIEIDNDPVPMGSNYNFGG